MANVGITEASLGLPDAAPSAARVAITDAALGLPPASGAAGRVAITEASLLLRGDTSQVPVWVVDAGSQQWVPAAGFFWIASGGQWVQIQP